MVVRKKEDPDTSETAISRPEKRAVEQRSADSLPPQGGIHAERKFGGTAVSVRLRDAGSDVGGRDHTPVGHQRKHTVTRWIQAGHMGPDALIINRETEPQSTSRAIKAKQVRSIAGPLGGREDSDATHHHYSVMYIAVQKYKPRL